MPPGVPVLEQDDFPDFLRIQMLFPRRHRRGPRHIAAAPPQPARSRPATGGSGHGCRAGTSRGGARAAVAVLLACPGAAQPAPAPWSWGRRVEATQWRGKAFETAFETAFERRLSLARFVIGVMFSTKRTTDEACNFCVLKSPKQ